MALNVIKPRETKHSASVAYYAKNTREIERSVRGALVVGGGGGTAFNSSALPWRGATLLWRRTQRAAVGARALRAATLQINLAAGQECLGCTQVSLADFDPDSISQKWYNVLSFRSIRR